MNKRYSLGLDIGISSVGWGLVLLDNQNNPYRILDTGVKVFSAAEVPKTGASKAADRRIFRGTRRLIRRREHRVNRIKRLLNIYGYLGENIFEGKNSDVFVQLQLDFEQMLEKYYRNKNITPYDLKVDALDRKLTCDELSIILVHYAKHRGYKSNRESDKNDSESGKVKKSIQENIELMQKHDYRIVSEMFLNDAKFRDKKRNSKDDYKTCIIRELYLEEIEKILDSQITFGLITEDFKKEYLEIWSSQRHYAKGPGKYSKYGGDLIAKMVGTCKFDGKPRAPKCAPSSELFVALTALLNLRYKEKREADYQPLTPIQIQKILDLAKNQSKVTYSKAFKELNINKVYIKGLVPNSKERDAAQKEFEKEYNKNFEYKSLTEEELKVYDDLRINNINKRTFIELKNYMTMKKKVIADIGTESWENLKDDYVTLDKIAEILTNYKTDEDVERKVLEADINPIYLDTIKSLPNFKDHNKLSLELIRELNELMMNGTSYKDAMKIKGYDHSNLNSQSLKQDLLIPINLENEITNQRVIRALSQTRGIINSIIKKYGMPEVINIETTRELSKSFKERRALVKTREENTLENNRIKELLVANNIFDLIEKISSTDVLKYKLWREQQEKCAYSLETISLEKLFERNYVQIDHILPYSRTFNDTYFNKTLVLTKYNQEKGNNTPYEWFGKTERWNQYEKYINSLEISDRKKDNYLLKKLTLELEQEYRNQNLNDTKYITKYLVSYIKAHLNVNKVGSPSGAITGKLRNYWHLNGLTHSLNSKDYYINNKDLSHKNRENHLHHAMDALIIAVTTPSLIKRVSDFERFRRYIDNQPLTKLVDYISGKDEGFDINQYVDENGVILETSLKDYAKEIRDKEYFNTRRNNTIQLLAPLPYENFDIEAKIRVYEMNKEQMLFSLKGIGYTDSELKDVNPIIPKFEREKISGKLHKETYYGMRTSTDGQIFKTSRIDISSSTFDDKKLENIIEKEGGSKDVYEAIKIWLNGEKGDIAFKKHGNYPLKPKSKDNSYIKKITIKEPYDGKGHILYGNKIVEKGNILEVAIYKKSGSNNLFFVGYDRFDIENIKKGKDFLVTIWPGQGKFESIQYSELNEKYSFYSQFRKNEYIKITLNTSEMGYAYVVGFSSGKFEITSALGDFGDLVGENRLFKNYMKGDNARYQLTVSTISAIEKVKLSNLGKIE